LNQDRIAGNDTAETSARLVMDYYPDHWPDKRAAKGMSAYRPLALPFGRRLEPSFFGPFHSPITVWQRISTSIWHNDNIQGLSVGYPASSRPPKWPGIDSGYSHPDRNTGQRIQRPAHVDLSWLDLESLVCSHGLGQPANGETVPNAFRYREWDWCMGDYLPDRVRVLERDIQGS
jgi:nitric oxide reductase NorD protein